MRVDTLRQKIQAEMLSLQSELEDLLEFEAAIVGDGRKTISDKKIIEAFEESHSAVVYTFLKVTMPKVLKLQTRVKHV